MEDRGGDRGYRIAVGVEMRGGAWRVGGGGEGGAWRVGGGVWKKKIGGCGEFCYEQKGGEREEGGGGGGGGKVEFGGVNA